MLVQRSARVQRGRCGAGHSCMAQWQSRRCILESTARRHSAGKCEIEDHVWQTLLLVDCDQICIVAIT